jgi:hypothetical protein
VGALASRGPSWGQGLLAKLLAGFTITSLQADSVTEASNGYESDRNCSRPVPSTSQPWAVVVNTATVSPAADVEKKADTCTATTLLPNCTVHHH